LRTKPPRVGHRSLPIFQKLLRIILTDILLYFFNFFIHSMRTMETITSSKVCDYDRDFRGCVLSVREYNGYHDSDFYATIWDDEQGCVREIEDGTTRLYAPSKYGRPDASDEVIAKARAWWAAKVGPKMAYSVLMGRRAFIDVGAEVEVIKGRKVSKGTTGEVVWKGADGFKKGAYRICIRLLDGTRVYTAMENVIKLGVVPPSEAEISEWIQGNNPY
jgi:hypothetical protein